MGVEKWANAWRAVREGYAREVKPPVSTSAAEMVLVSTCLDSCQAKSLVVIPSISLHAQSIIRSRIATWGTTEQWASLSPLGTMVAVSKTKQFTASTKCR
jgi:hypothetical protein